LTGLRIGVIGIPGKWSTETLADEIEERTSHRLVIDMADVSADLSNGSLSAGGVDLCSLDGLIVKKISQQYSPNTLDRIELLRMAEQAGVRVFSPSETMVRMIDRLSCTMTLNHSGIPMPATTITEDPQQAVGAVLKYGEAVFKPLYSTKARGMCVINDQSSDTELHEAIDAYRAANPMMYIQQKVRLQGRDLGIVFLGGKYLGSYARVARGDAWNTTIASGGKYAACQPSASTIKLAERAQALFRMDFTTVDVAETGEGPVVFEVSAFGGFRGAKEGIGINAAALYADYVLGELSR
jgi:ribosomal protein S6--L-glutamate ligase